MHAQRQFTCNAAADVDQSSALDACSSKDENLANEPPCLIANRLLNGTSPQNCPLDSTTMAWVERNHALHGEDLEALAQKQEMLAVAAEGSVAGCPASEALFKRAAGFRSKRVHYQPDLYSSPWEKDDAAVCDISTSFKKQCTSFNDVLKQRALLEEAAIVNKSCDERRGSGSLRSTKPRGKSKTKAGGAQADVIAERVARPTRTLTECFIHRCPPAAKLSTPARISHDQFRSRDLHPPSGHWRRSVSLGF